LRGPLSVGRAQLVLDTGAVYTVVHPSFLERIGATSTGEISVRTLERTLRLPVFTVERISVFGATLNQYPVLAYAPAAFTPGIDGVLSIDIFHALKARLDFAAGTLTIP
jgi:predicted aspartyl protease